MDKAQIGSAPVTHAGAEESKSKGGDQPIVQKPVAPEESGDGKVTRIKKGKKVEEPPKTEATPAA